MVDNLPAHSPLGASGAERWMNCPASVSLAQGHQDEESEHAALGTAAHAIGEYCLRTNTAPWTLAGKAWAMDDGKLVLGVLHSSRTPIDQEMIDAITVYVDFVNAEFPDRNQGNFWIERRFHCPTIHPLFFGTSDACGLPEHLPRTVSVADYKHGAGIVVEAKDNEQLMYYGCGVLENLGLWDKVDTVRLTIVQPRAFHFDGPVRTWEVSTDDLLTWLETKLVPAMNEAAQGSRKTKSGEHCRFCPVRAAACPQILSDVEELEALMEKLGKDGAGAAKMTNEDLARFLDLGEVFKIARTAALKTATARVEHGAVVPGWKLSKARANQEFKDGAEAEAKKKFGDDAYTKPELLSPAQMKKLPGGEAFCARWAFKPDRGLTLVQADDARPAVSKDVKSHFKATRKAK